MKQVVKWESEDGLWFDSEEACLRHEGTSKVMKALGRDLESTGYVEMNYEEDLAEYLLLNYNITKK